MSLDIWLTVEVDTGGAQPHTVTLYDANITHNLNSMAEEGGFYKHLWRPEEVGVKQAKDLITPLTNGIRSMIREPGRFRQKDSPNGWGTYDDFLPWLQRLLEACRAHPKASVAIHR